MLNNEIYEVTINYNALHEKLSELGDEATRHILSRVFSQDMTDTILSDMDATSLQVGKYSGLMGLASV